MRKQKYPRINLAFYNDNLDYVREAAWKNRMSITEYINKLLEKDRQQSSENIGDLAKHARWEMVDEYCCHAKEFRCTACGSHVYYDHYARSCEYDFCPNCGAEMESEPSAASDR